MSCVWTSCTYARPVREAQLVWDNTLTVESGDGPKFQNWMSFASGKTVVVDFDNTLVKNDLGDAMCAWMIDHGLVKSIPWAQLPYLNVTPTPDTLRHVIWESTEAFLEDTETLKGSYALCAQLVWGYTEEEVREMSRQLISETLLSPDPVDVSDPSMEVHFYQKTVEWVHALQEAGADVWIVSASHQVLIEEAARLIGINKDHVIGVRIRMTEGKYAIGLEPCGHLEHVMTYKAGKRAWINQVIFHDQLRPDAQSPVYMAFGDSITDRWMLEDAQYRVVVDRDVPALKELVARAPDCAVLLHRP